MGTIKQSGNRQQAGKILRTAFKNYRIMFYQEARAYIEKLIRIQSYLDKKKYWRMDQQKVRVAIKYLNKYLDYYRYDSDAKMRGFFTRNQEKIRTLLPHKSYPGYQKLLNEFFNLQNQKL